MNDKLPTSGLAPTGNESQAKMDKARRELTGLEDPGTYWQRLVRIYDDLKFMSVALIQTDQLEEAQKLLLAAGHVESSEMDPDLADKEWDGLP